MSINTVEIRQFAGPATVELSNVGIPEIVEVRQGPQGPQGAQGIQGATGATGAAGPNEVTSATTSDGTCDLILNSLSFAGGGITDFTSIVSNEPDATVSLGGGGLSGFAAPSYYAAASNSASLKSGVSGLSCLTWGASDGQNLTVPSGTALTFDNTSYTYGTGAAASHRTALGLTTIATTTAGTGVTTALSVNVGSAGAFVVNGGALGTPSSGTLTSCTGLPISTGVSGLASGIATFLQTPSSANLAAAVTDETGTGSLVFANAPTFTGGLQFSSSAVAVATMENLGTRRVTRATLATRTSGSLVADDTLVLPVVSGVTYRIVVHTLTKNSTATVGMVARLDHPTITATGSEVVGHLTNSGGNATVTPSSSTALTNMVNQNGQNLSTRMEVILTPAASGDVKVMWGARVPAGVETAGLNAGSYLEITQLI